MKKTNILLLLVLYATVVNSSNAQLANTYLNDVGIENDINVLFVEKFDDGLPNIFSRYTDKLNTAGMSLDNYVPPGSKGLYSLKMTNTGGLNNGGHLFKKITPGWDSTIYVRYYVKYPAISKGYIHHEGVWFGGYNPATNYPNPRAGICGLGDSRLTISYEPVNNTLMNTYLYWGEMHNAPDGKCWGNTMVHGNLTPAAIRYDEWMCIEIMIKLNNPVTASNGELRIWQDGVEVGYRGPGFPKGSWTWDKFNANAAAAPFPGFQWRIDANLKINYLWIEYYDDQSPANVSHYIKYDHLVVARKRIGPIAVSNAPGSTADSSYSVRFSPNPTTNKVTIEILNPDPQKKEIVVYNSVGEKVYSAITSLPKTTVNIAQFSAGLYIFEVNDGGKINRKKIIKN